GVRSRFLDEIPAAHLQWLTPQDQRIAAPQNPSWQGAFRRGGNSYRSAGNSAQPLQPRSATNVVMVNEQQFRIGQGVRHAKFGEGIIIQLSGSASDAQAQIQFRDVGTKTLALGVAKLEITAG